MEVKQREINEKMEKSKDMHKGVGGDIDFDEVSAFDFTDLNESMMVSVDDYSILGAFSQNSKDDDVWEVVGGVSASAAAAS